MSGPHSSEQITKAQAFAQRVQSGKYSPAVQAQIDNATKFATFFDIETGGLDPKSNPIYEMGFQHGMGPSAQFKHHFVNPGNGEISDWSAPRMAQRDAESGGAFNNALANGMSQREAARTAYGELAGRDIWVQNLRHERSFLNERIGKEGFNEWARQSHLESFSHGSGLYPTSPALKSYVAEAGRQGLVGNTDSVLNAWEDVFTKGFAPTLANRQPGVTRAFDIMDLTKSVFAMAQKRGHMTKTGELFTGTSVDTFSKGMFGIEELHEALPDNVMQSSMVERFLGAGYAMQNGEDLDPQTAKFFKTLGDAIPEIKRRNTVKGLVDTFQSQQQYLATVAEGKPNYDLLQGARTSFENRAVKSNLEVLQPNGSYKSEETEFFLRKKAHPKYNPDQFSTNIEDIVSARKARDAESRGIKVDWDAAYAQTHREYIAPYQEALAGHRGRGMAEPEAIRAALKDVSGHAERLASAPSAKLTDILSESTSSGKKASNFLKENWKVGLGAVGAIIAANYISSKDDDYNYLEGLRHGGIAGATRKHNTDFGSGWQGTQKDIEDANSMIVTAGMGYAALKAAPAIKKNIDAGNMFRRGYGTFYHGTPTANVESIRAGGIVPNTKDFEKIKGQMGLDPATRAAIEEKATHVYFTMEPNIARIHAGAELGLFGGSGPSTQNMQEYGGLLGYYNPSVYEVKGNGKIFEMTLSAEEIMSQRGMKSQWEAVAKNFGAPAELASIIGSVGHFDALTEFNKGGATIDLSKVGAISPDAFTAEIDVVNGVIGKRTALRDVTAKATPMMKEATRHYAAAAVSLGIVGLFANRLLSGKDAQNTIEGLGHPEGASTTVKSRRKNTDFGSGWQGLKSFFSTDGGKVILGAAGVGVVAGIGTGEFSKGYNAFTMGLGGASVGFLKGGMKGAIGGMVAGAATGLASDYAAEALGGNFGSAVLAGVSTSLASSLMVASNIRGGLMYKPMMSAIEAVAPQMHGGMEGIVDMYKMMGMDIHGPRGFAQDPTKMLAALAAANKNPTATKISNFMTENPKFSRMVDATMGSPGLLEAADKFNGAEKIPGADLAKIIAGDLAEGLPLGLGFGAIGWALGSNTPDPNKRIEALTHPGGASTTTQRRHSMTDFGSGYQGMRIAFQDLMQEVTEFSARQNAMESLRQDREEKEQRKRGKRRLEGFNKGFRGDAVADFEVDDTVVEDADTVSVEMANGQQMTMRLAGIDAPEIKHENDDGSSVWPDQPYGQQAKKNLQALIAQQKHVTAVIDPLASQSYGRSVGMLYGDNGMNLNLELVRQGSAAALPYGKNKEQIASKQDFTEAELEAAAAQNGMWGYDEWQIARDLQTDKKRITNTSYTNLGRLFKDFKTSAILMRMRDPDSDLADMQAAGGKDDFNIMEGMKHGWVGASRRQNTDFGSGYQILDDMIPAIGGSSRTTKHLQQGHMLATTRMRMNMKRSNLVKHHVG